MFVPNDMWYLAKWTNLTCHVNLLFYYPIFSWLLSKMKTHITHHSMLNKKNSFELNDAFFIFMLKISKVKFSNVHLVRIFSPLCFWSFLKIKNHLIFMAKLLRAFLMPTFHCGTIKKMNVIGRNPFQKIGLESSVT